MDIKQNKDDKLSFLDDGDFDWSDFDDAQIVDDDFE